MEQTGYSKTLHQFLDLWVRPEIRRRHRNGMLKEGFVLRAFQVVFPSPDDSKPNLVRLNDEVKVMAKVKLRKSVQKGEAFPITADDIQGGMRLVEDDEPNAGHFTAIWFDGIWVMGWDFRYNKQRARTHAEVAKQFLAVAKFALTENYLNAFIDTLFSAAEMLAKSHLLLVPLPERREKHRWIQIHYQTYEKATVLNKLSGLRDRARYLKQPVNLTAQETRQLMTSVEDMLAEAQRAITA